MLFFSYLLFSLAILQIRIIKAGSVFINALLLAILLTSALALWVTSGKTILIYPLVVVFLYLIRSGKVSFEIKFNALIMNLIFVSFVFIILFILYFRNGDLYILHPDYLFWIRLIDTNLEYGVENTGTFYNTVSGNYPSNELYHYFEFWLTCLGKLVNNQSTATNLFLFAYPVGGVLLITGLKELLQTFISFKSEFQKTFITFLLFVFLLFFSHPWELLTQFSWFQKLPISSMHPWWQGYKICFVTLAALPLFIFWRTKKSEWLYYLSFSVFLYPPVLPILLVVACVTWGVEWFRKNNPPFLSLVSLFASGMFFILFYKLTGNGGATVSGFAPAEWLTLSNWFRYLPAMLMKSLFIPIIALVPVFVYLIYSRKENILQKSLFLNILVMYVICMGVWMMFIKNVDANQSFLLLFTPVVGLSVLILSVHLWFRKRFIIAFLLVVVYVIPGLAKAITHQSSIPKPGSSTTSFLKAAGASSILYIPGENENTNVYQFNERVYTGIDHFIVQNPDIKLFSVVAASITDTSMFNPVTLNMYQTYRNRSPYFQSCGYIQPGSDCLLNWMKQNRIQYVCARPGTAMPDFVRPVSVDNDFIIYQLK